MDLIPLGSLWKHDLVKFTDLVCFFVLLNFE